MNKSGLREADAKSHTKLRPAPHSTRFSFSLLDPLEAPTTMDTVRILLLLPDGLHSLKSYICHRVIKSDHALSGPLLDLVRYCCLLQIQQSLIVSPPQYEVSDTTTTQRSGPASPSYGGLTSTCDITRRVWRII